MTRAEAACLASLWLFLMCVYWLTMPPDISFEDTPTFAGACATLGLAHPPGYPVHTLYCAPFANALHALSFPYARGAALGSSFDAATAATVLAWLLSRMVRSRPAAFLAAGLWGLSPTLWGLGQVPEVYALNSLMVAATLAFAYMYREGGSRRWLLAVAFATGQGLANHWPLYVLTYPAFLLVLAPAWRRALSDLRARRFAAWCLLSFLVGLSPYLHLLFVSPDSYLFDRSYSPRDFFSYVGRQAYWDYAGATLSAAEHARAVAIAALSFLAEFRFLFGLLAVAGLVSLARGRRWSLLAAVLWGMLATTALLAAARPFEPGSELSRHWFSVYMAQAHGFAAVALAFALAASFSRLRMKAAISSLACVAVLVTVAAGDWGRMDRSKENVAWPAARLVVDSVPPGGLLLVGGDDFFNFPIEYAAFFGEGDAPEVVGFGDFVSGLEFEEIGPVLAALGRPISYTVKPRYLESSGERFHGLHYSLDASVPPGTTKIDVTEDTRSFLARMLDLGEKGVRDTFTRYFIERVLVTYAVEALEARRGGAELAAGDGELLSRMLEGPVGKFAVFVVASRSAAPSAVASEIDERFAVLSPVLGHLTSPRASFALFAMSGVRRQAGDVDGARKLLEKALAAWPSNQNAGVVLSLLGLLDEQGDYQAYAEVRSSYPALYGAEPGPGADGRCEAALGTDCRP